MTEVAAEITSTSSVTSSTLAAQSTDDGEIGESTEAPEGGTASSTTTTPAIDMMRSILGKSIKCTLDDGRTATGTFVCMDRLKNLILTNVIEERYIDSSDYTTTNTAKLLARRELSQAMVPGSHLMKVEIDQSLYESHMMNSSSNNNKEEKKNDGTVESKSTNVDIAVVDKDEAIIDATVSARSNTQNEEAAATDR